MRKESHTKHGHKLTEGEGEVIVTIDENNAMLAVHLME
jgi:hypothetical protein